MKSWIALVILVVMALLAPQVSSAAVCTNATLTGPYAVIASGVFVDDLVPYLRVIKGLNVRGGSYGSSSSTTTPFYAGGLVTANGTGRLTFTLTTSTGGSINRLYTFPGTYSINADCTGTLTMMSGFLGIIVNFDVAFDRSNTELKGTSSDQGVGVNLRLIQQ